jgi:hypothetical protein
MKADFREALVSQIIGREDENSCWHVLEDNDPRSREWNYYVPTF